MMTSAEILKVVNQGLESLSYNRFTAANSRRKHFEIKILYFEFFVR